MKPRASGGISVAVMQQTAARVDQAESVPARDIFAGDAAVVTPSPAIRAYLQAYGLCVIAITRDQTVHLTRDVGRLRPLPVLAAWWGPAAACVRIKQLLDRQGSVDVLAAAASLRVVVAPHDAVIAKARDAVGRIDHALEVAQANGLLKLFNHRYRIERQKARAQGRQFPPYGAAFTRFKRLLYTAAPGAEGFDGDIVNKALGVVPEATQPSSAVRW